MISLLDCSIYMKGKLRDCLDQQVAQPSLTNSHDALHDDKR